MSNVVKIQRPDVIWVCQCGGASFELRADGSAVCCDCEKQVTGAEGSWFDLIKNVDRETADKPNYTFRGNDDGTLARRIALRNAGEADWIICGKNAGTITEWAALRLPKADRESLKERIDYGVRLLMEDMAKGQDE